MARPTIGQGDVGTDVKDLLTLLPTYFFDDALDKAVRDYQRSRGLEADGIVGPQTWAALESNAPPYVPPGLPPPLSQQTADAIAELAHNSEAADIDWDDRGMAPAGYSEGVALSYANTYRQWLVGYPAALDMAKAPTNSEKDILNEYANEFSKAGMKYNAGGAETLRSVWSLLWGLGMRESSGQHCCGRDQSAENTSSDTCEAGAWQTSYNAHNASPAWDDLFDAFAASTGTQGFGEYFAQGVTCSSSDWKCYGSGDGYLHQEMSKNTPAYAAEVCALTLRNLCNHYGPVNRHEVELRREVYDLLHAIEQLVDRTEA